MSHVAQETVLRTRAPRRLYERIEAWRTRAGLSLSEALRFLLVAGLDAQERQAEREAA